MSNQSLGNRVQAELKQAVESGLLPDSMQENAEKLLIRLQKPVRLALLGLPGSGKSTLMNLLVGEQVIPPGVRLPSLQLLYGGTKKSVCTLPDGSKTVLDGVDVMEIEALSPVFVEIHMPLPALAKISILEVVAPNDPTAVHRASQWAVKRCDVALWCTRGFNQSEQQIWSAMPDLIKDHALCMITRADLLRAEGLFEATVGAVNSAATDEFKQILPIGTTEAIAARRADGTVNKEVMRESGGTALMSAILKQVDLGRQSAVDMADVLLHQNADRLAALSEKPQAAVTEENQAEPEAIESTASEDHVTGEQKPEQTSKEPEFVMPVVSAEPAPRTDARDAISRLREIAAKKRVSRDASFEAEAESGADEVKVAPEPEAEAIPEPVTAPVESAESLSPATRDAYAHVISYIEENGAGMSSAIKGDSEAGRADVIALAVEHIQWLCDYLNENGDAADASLQRTRDSAYDAADLVQLMEMEKRDSAALEAVSLMLQIKRELQADLAA